MKGRWREERAAEDTLLSFSSQKVYAYSFLDKQENQSILVGVTILKTCCQCKVPQPPADFYRGCPRCIACDSARSKDYYSTHRQTVISRAVKWNREHPAQAAEHRKAYASKNARETHLIRKYCLTLHDFNRMLEEQGGVCAICKEPSDTWDVDHDHATGQVRAILCHGCNAGIGFLKDSARVASAASEYLTKHGKP